MRLLLPAIIATLIVAACNPSATKKSFSGADSLVIHFKDEQAGVVTKTVQTTESAAIRKVVGFIDGASTGKFKCGYDGKMFFYKKGTQIQEVDFKMKEDSCKHFSFLLDGKIVSTKMNNEATDFLNSLERGQLWY